MTEDDHVTSSHSDGDSSSRTDHESDEDSDLGDHSSSKANSEDQVEDDYRSELANDHWPTNAMTKEHKMTHTAEKHRTPSKSNLDGDSDSFSEPHIANVPIDECDTTNHKLEPCLDVTFGLHSTSQIHRTALFLFSYPPHIEAHVQYNLALSPCTIQSGAISYVM